MTRDFWSQLWGCLVLGLSISCFVKSMAASGVGCPEGSNVLGIGVANGFLACEPQPRPFLIRADPKALIEYHLVHFRYPIKAPPSRSQKPRRGASRLTLRRCRNVRNSHPYQCGQTTIRPVLKSRTFTHSLESPVSSQNQVNRSGGYSWILSRPVL